MSGVNAVGANLPFGSDELVPGKPLLSSRSADSRGASKPPLEGDGAVTKEGEAADLTFSTVSVARDSIRFLRRPFVSFFFFKKKKTEDDSNIYILDICPHFA